METGGMKKNDLKEDVEWLWDALHEAADEVAALQKDRAELIARYRNDMLWVAKRERWVAQEWNKLNAERAEVRSRQHLQVQNHMLQQVAAKYAGQVADLQNELARLKAKPKEYAL